MKKMKWRGVFLFVILLSSFVSFSQDSDFKAEVNVVFQSGFEEGNEDNSSIASTRLVYR